MKQYKYYWWTLFFVWFVFSCSNSTDIPKKYGYFRIDFPKKKYQKVTFETFPFAFEKSEYAIIRNRDKENDSWFDLVYPNLKATIYFSYKPINRHQNLYSLLNESQTMVYKHKVRATAIYEKSYVNRDRNVLGITYELTGDVASNMQFILTDSLKYFVRGALYFDSTSNSDSIAPMVDYVKEDIRHLIETFEWHNSKKCLNLKK